MARSAGRPVKAACAMDDLKRDKARFAYIVLAWSPAGGVNLGVVSDIGRGMGHGATAAIAILS